MITTTEFEKLTEAAKLEVILDGLTFQKISTREAAVNANRLTQWMATVDMAGADPHYTERFLGTTKELEENIDLLTSRFIDAAKIIKQAREMINRKKLSDRLTKTPR
jgi:transposase